MKLVEFPAKQWTVADLAEADLDNDEFHNNIKKTAQHLKSLEQVVFLTTGKTEVTERLIYAGSNRFSAVWSNDQGDYLRVWFKDFMMY